MQADKVKLRTFTLPELREAISSALEETSAPSESSGRPQATPDASASYPESPVIQTPPSLQTLKNWSSNGVFKNAVTLQSATRLAMANMATNARYYSKSKEVGRTDKGQSGHPSQPAAQTEELLADQILKEVRALAQRIDRLEQTLGHAHPQVVDPSNGANTVQTHPEGLNKVMSAIDQLDIIRRHLMLRFDSEMQLLKQASVVQAKQQLNAASVIENQRILTKLSNIEQLVITLRS